MTRYLFDFRQDTVYALRVLAKSPGFTAVGVASLMLGIGVCSVFYSEINALMLRPIPAVRDPGALVAFETLTSYPYFERVRDRGAVAASVTAFVGPAPFSFIAERSRAAKAIRISGHLVSPEYFEILGLQPAAGRFFRSESEKEGTAPVAVITDRLWRTRLNSDPGVIGRVLLLNGKSVTVIGVAPKDFLGIFPVAPVDVFLPVTSAASVAPELSGNALHRKDVPIFRVLARLGPGVRAERAEAAFDATVHQLDEENAVPETARRGRKVRLISAGGMMPLAPDQRSRTITFMVVLMSLILSLACINLANLLLARSSRRQKEIGLRIALGANRFRLIRQLLTECVVISLTGGVASVGLTYWLTGLVSRMRLPGPVVFEFNIRPDWTVFAVTFLISALAGLGFGLLPALAATRADLTPSLKGEQGRIGGRRFGARNLLIAYQVATSLMLLLIVGYLVLGYRRTSHVDPGFATAGVLLMEIDPARDGYTEPQIARLLEAVPERLSHSAGVDQVTLAEAAPFADMIAKPNARFSAPHRSGRVQLGAVRQRIGANYFATLGVPLVRGREFTAQDVRNGATPGAPQPVLVNQTGARELFGEQEALGQRLQDATTGASYFIVGITRDLRAGFFSSTPVPTVFTPLTSDPQNSAATDPLAALSKGSFGAAPGATIVVRSAPGVDAAAVVRTQLTAIDPSLTVFNSRTMTDQLEQMNGLIQMGTILYSGIGVFGLLLASIGLAGITSYAVARRTREIGIRTALGARPGQILRLVMREGAALVAVGTVVGFAGAMVIARVLSSMAAELAQAFGASTGDPVLLAGAPLLLAGVTLLACYLPARRAAKINPLEALRQE